MLRIRVDVDPKHNLRRSFRVPEPQRRQYNLPYPEQTRNFHIGGKAKWAKGNFVEMLL